ncbi:putative transposase of the Rover hAT-like DNA transposon [Lachancea lanzarotensis]|uniref:LALA0S11e01332g1_1 n=1 Tax=Lachancea lanzarotensis TaxID=1245769 RepID=A0A0C7MWE0_9SACH|nr:putative transposase of the Rover hAT-like DNA transposon [Lachancea lanzarotensis]CEP64315.1 putative transposase of the Rover hAT-like DNA transposon [Lachancea lanzarotensis]
MLPNEILDKHPDIIEQEMPTRAGSNLRPPLEAESSSGFDSEDSFSGTTGTNKTLSRLPKANQGWMGKSSLLVFFDITIVNGKKTAHCKHCRKPYKEGDSTGNMSKHIRGVHPAAFKAHKGKVVKNKELNFAAKKKTKTLRISKAIQNEHKRNRHNFTTALLVVEGFLSLSIVEQPTWRFFVKNVPNQTEAPVRSRNALVRKLKAYSSMLNDTLSLNLGDTHLVNIQLDVRTARGGESYMGMSVSFAPNMWNKKLLDCMEDHSLLLNDAGLAQNTHLLDFVCLGPETRAGPNILAVFMKLLKKHNLTDKVATITMNSAENNASMYQSFICSLAKDDEPLAGRLMGKARYIRSASQVIDLQVEEILSELSKHEDFAVALRRIKTLAKVMRACFRIRYKLRDDKIPLIPLGAPTSGTYVWRQLNSFLDNYKKYKTWFEKRDKIEDSDIIEKLREYIHYDEGTLEMLKYLVQSLQLLYDSSSKLQRDFCNQLSNGVPFYYLVDHFYSYCENALEERQIIKSGSGPDFSCLNGVAELRGADKRLVLEAILTSRESFNEHLTRVERDPLYYVAVILDPGANTEALFRMLSQKDAKERISEASLFIQNYFKEYDEFIDLRASSPVEEHGSVENRDLLFDQANLPKVSFPKTSDNTATTENPEFLAEWAAYMQENPLKERTKETAIAWWYQHRSDYPRLFPLAMSLFYTKLSACEVDRTFSLAAKITRKGRGWLSSRKFRTLLLLRDRFEKFGFYEGGPMPVGDLFEDDDLDDDNDDYYVGEPDPFDLCASSDEVMYDTDTDSDGMGSDGD